MENNIKNMNILLACDSGYVMPLSVCMTSIFENNKKNNICVYILHSKLLDAQKETLAGMAKSYQQTIQLIEIGESYFADAPALRWSKETYYRLLISEILPNTIDRLLYLDVDIIVNKPLNDLYELDLGEFAIGALQEKGDYPIIRKRLGLPVEGYYYQAGVLLFDMEKFFLGFRIVCKCVEFLDLGKIHNPI